MRISLNIKKSIEADWVVDDRQDFDAKFNYYFNICFKIAVVGMFIGFPIFLWIGIYTGRMKSFSTIVFPGLIFLIGLVGLYGSLLGNKFIRFRGGHDLNLNREVILKSLHVYYPDNNFYDGGNFLTSYRTPRGFRKPTRRILVIFDNYDILINIAQINYAGIQSPFHTLFYHLRINEIKRDLIGRIKNVTQQQL